MKKLYLFFLAFLFVHFANATNTCYASMDTVNVEVQSDEACPGTVINFNIINKSSTPIDSIWWKGDRDPNTGVYLWDRRGEASNANVKSPRWIFATNNGVGKFPITVEVKNILGFRKTYYDTVETGEPWVNIINDPATCCDLNDTIKIDVRFLTKPYNTIQWFDNANGNIKPVFLQNIDKFPISILAGRSSIDLGVIIEDSKGCNGRTNVFFNLTTNVNEVRKYKLTLSPNPTNSTLYIQGLSKEYNNSAVIYSIQGQLIRNTEIINNNEIDLSDLSPGIYIMKLNNETHRIIKL